MKQYSIPCTEEQAKKAIKLGAPIKHKEVTDLEGHLFDYNITETPTAEEMFGWLEEQGLIVTTDIGFTTEWYSYVKRNRELLFLEHRFSTRKEATLAAIDAALDYLTNNKKAK